MYSVFSVLNNRKFTVNGQFELNEKDNRKIIVSHNDTKACRKAGGRNSKKRFQ